MIKSDIFPHWPPVRQDVVKPLPVPLGISRGRCSSVWQIPPEKRRIRVAFAKALRSICIEIFRHYEIFFLLLFRSSWMDRAVLDIRCLLVPGDDVSGV